MTDKQKDIAERCADEIEAIPMTPLSKAMQSVVDKMRDPRYCITSWRGCNDGVWLWHFDKGYDKSKTRIHKRTLLGLIDRNFIEIENITEDEIEYTLTPEAMNELKDNS